MANYTMIRTPEEELAEVTGRPDHCRVKPEDERRFDSIDDVRKVLAEITFAPSCVDMGWGWEIEATYSLQLPPALTCTGYLLRTTFRRPDRDTGAIETGFGRWWHIPLNPTESAIVKTAFAAAKMILEHELMESFKWKNARPFDPHNTVQELVGLHGGRWTMSIP